MYIHRFGWRDVVEQYGKRAARVGKKVCGGIQSAFSWLFPSGVYSNINAMDGECIKARVKDDAGVFGEISSLDVVVSEFDARKYSLALRWEVFRDAGAVASFILVRGIFYPPFGSSMVYGQSSDSFTKCLVAAGITYGVVTACGFVRKRIAMDNCLSRLENAVKQQHESSEHAVSGVEARDGYEGFLGSEMQYRNEAHRESVYAPEQVSEKKKSDSVVQERSDEPVKKFSFKNRVWDAVRRDSVAKGCFAKEINWQVYDWAWAERAVSDYFVKNKDILARYVEDDSEASGTSPEA